MNIDWRDMLPRIDIPVLICAGGEDPQAPAASAQAAAALIPSATVVSFAQERPLPVRRRAAGFQPCAQDILQRSLITMVAETSGRRKAFQAAGG